MNTDSAHWTLLRHGEFGNQNLCKGGNTKMKKKTLTIAIALVLVVALAVGATWALLTHSTETVPQGARHRLAGRDWPVCPENR